MINKLIPVYVVQRKANDGWITVSFGKNSSGIYYDLKKAKRACSNMAGYDDIVRVVKANLSFGEVIITKDGKAAWQRKANKVKQDQLATIKAFKEKYGKQHIIYSISENQFKPQIAEFRFYDLNKLKEILPEDTNKKLIKLIDTTLASSFNFGFTINNKLYPLVNPVIETLRFVKFESYSPKNKYFDDALYSLETEYPVSFDNLILEGLSPVLVSPAALSPALI